MGCTYDDMVRGGPMRFRGSADPAVMPADTVVAVEVVAKTTMAGEPLVNDCLNTREEADK